MDIKPCGRTPEDRVKSYHKIHYTWTDKAINADEANDIENAVQYYIKGLECTNMCLEEKVIGESHSQIRAREIQEKMKKNRDSEIERLEYLLSSKLKADKSKPQLKKSSSLEMDKTDSGKSNPFRKSLRDKKPDKRNQPRKDSCGDGEIGDGKMGKRSHSATCINKIEPVSEGNLARALGTGGGPKAKPGTAKPSVPAGSPRQPVTPTATRARNVGPPRPKLTSQTSANTPAQTGTTGDNRNVDKTSIMSKLKNVDKELVETIINEVLDSKVVTFEDIAGNESAKQCLLETVIYPKLRPELFTGLRSPAKGILLFGPPGNGKTLLAKAVANESRCVFFNISAASLMSKWVGEGEKMVRALFAVARAVEPAVIFLDEVDSLLSARSSDDKSVTRRMLTQFLQEIDGAGSDGTDKVLVMAATNRPDELDDAALRRFQKKIYINMPDAITRKHLLKALLTKHGYKLKEADIDKLVDLTKNYSSSDLNNLAKCAAMIPIRELNADQIRTVTLDSMRKIRYSDFITALKQIKPSVPPTSLARYDKWNSQFGDTS